ncbi:hypothetical protein, partial [Salmonella enterica]|uniref:hypothetical protein n=1 Tax=Salmonella enterica TaxID=28901 RepID=UPI0020C45E9E
MAAGRREGAQDHGWMRIVLFSLPCVKPGGMRTNGPHPPGRVAPGHARRARSADQAWGRIPREA